MNTDQGSLSLERVALNTVVEGPVNRVKARQKLGDTFNYLIDKLYPRIAERTENSLIVIMENINDDHNMAYVLKIVEKTYTLHAHIHVK